MKPKMQLSPGDYVSDAFRAEINAWMVDFFGYEEDQKPIAVSVCNDANIVKAKTKRQKKASSSKSLGDLLANIDETFKLLEFYIDDVSFYRSLKSDIVGLKKCSPLITDKTFLLSDVPSETVKQVMAENKLLREEVATLRNDRVFMLWQMDIIRTTLSRVVQP